MDNVIKEVLDISFTTTCSIIDPKSFEGRLWAVCDKLDRLLFGMAYDVSDKKMLKRKRDNETFIRLLADFDSKFKNFQRNQIIHICIDEIININEWFKMIVESNVSLNYHEKEIFCFLGFQRNFSGISKPEEYAMKFQVAAQVLWFLNENPIPTLEAMRKTLASKSSISAFLGGYDGSSYPNSRSVCNWISKVFPNPNQVKQGRPKKKQATDNFFGEFTSVPGVFSDARKKINCVKLRFVLQSITLVLNKLGWPEEKIMETELIQFYVGQLHPSLSWLWKAWVHEALVKK